MTDKIVQLVDKNNNNIYPVAGSLKQGSVTSSTINNGAVTSAKIDFSTFADYSLNEMNTGVKWIDGSAIYKKTVSMGNLPNVAEGIKTVAHGISNLGLIVKIEGVYHSSTDDDTTFSFDSPSVHSGGDPNMVAIRTCIKGSDILVTVGMDRSSYSGYITLYYTKSS